MKKKIIVLALIVTLLCSGCGSKIPTLSNGDEAVVTLKDGEMISVNDLYAAVKNEYALQSLIQLMDKKVLEKEYADKLEEAKNEADDTAAYYEQLYGEEDFKEALTQSGYSDVEAFKNDIYLNYLQNLAIEDYCKAQIKDKEIQKYYDDKIVGDIKVSQILITPKVTDSMTADEKSAAEKEAKEKIESIIAELNKTDKKEVADKFAELAKEHSEDTTSKDNGGSLGFINKDTLSSYYDELVDAAYKLKVGEYSKKIIVTELGYHVILVTDSKTKAPIEDVKEDILDNLGSEYLKQNPEARVKALQEIRKKYDVKIVDDELQKQYSNYIQNQLLQYQQQASASGN